LDLRTNNLPEPEFSEENQQVAMKRERQLLLLIHLLFAIPTNFPRLPLHFHDSRGFKEDQNCKNGPQPQSGRVI
jgi:hypothetical protein